MYFLFSYNIFFLYFFIIKLLDYIFTCNILMQYPSNILFLFLFILIFYLFYIFILIFFYNVDIGD